MMESVLFGSSCIVVLVDNADLEVRLVIGNAARRLLWLFFIEKDLRVRLHVVLAAGDCCLLLDTLGSGLTGCHHQAHCRLRTRVVDIVSAKPVRSRKGTEDTSCKLTATTAVAMKSLTVNLDCMVRE